VRKNTEKTPAEPLPPTRFSTYKFKLFFLPQNQKFSLRPRVEFSGQNDGSFTANRANFKLHYTHLYTELWISPSIYAFDAALRVWLASILPQQGGMLIHASAIVFQQQAFVFPGPSGAGKTTLSRLLGPDILNDEIVALLPGTENNYEVWGTPFWGEMGTGPWSPIAYPLAGLMFPVKRKKLSLEILPTHQSLMLLLRTVCHFAQGKDEAARLLELAYKVCSQQPSYKLRFPKEEQLKEKFVALLTPEQKDKRAWT